MGNRFNATQLSRGAFAAGLVAAVTLLAIGRVSATGGELGLSATLATGPTGELAVAPVGRVAWAQGLRPGEGELRGRVVVRSEAAATLEVRVRARPSMADADASLLVEVRSGPKTLYRGSAGGLRTASPVALRLPARAEAALDVRAWLPAGAQPGWAGRSITFPLEYVTRDSHGFRR
jgi:hypothetical protein